MRFKKEYLHIYLIVAFFMIGQVILNTYFPTERVVTELQYIDISGGEKPPNETIARSIMYALEGDSVNNNIPVVYVNDGIAYSQNVAPNFKDTLLKGNRIILFVDSIPSEAMLSTIPAKLTMTEDFIDESEPALALASFDYKASPESASFYQFQDIENAPILEEKEIWFEFRLPKFINPNRCKVQVRRKKRDIKSK